jgi:hypothetical protein
METIVVVLAGAMAGALAMAVAVVILTLLQGEKKPVRLARYEGMGEKEMEKAFRRGRNHPVLSAMLQLLDEGVIKLMEDAFEAETDSEMRSTVGGAEALVELKLQIQEMIERARDEDAEAAA